MRFTRLPVESDIAAVPGITGLRYDSIMNQYGCIIIAIVVVALTGPRARGDEVTLKNGDRLNGKITTDGSNLTVDTGNAGKYTVDLKNVKTFSSAKPAEVVLSDGTSLRAHIDSGPDGKVTLAPAVGPVRVVKFSDLKAVNPPPVKWVGSVLIGGVLARGNTDSDTFNAAVNFSRKGDHDRVAFDAQYILARTKGPGQPKQETTDDLIGNAKYDYFFTPRFYGYGLVQAEHDVIAKLAIRVAPGLGGGYQWFDTKPFSLNTEAGVGYLYRQYSGDGHTSSVDARAAYHVKGSPYKHISVFHDFEYLPGLDRLSNFFFDTDAGIRADITDKLYTEFKIQYEYDSRPAPGRGSSDVRYILGVGWNF